MARISRDRDDVHIALLRGVNVGGTKKVPMLELRELARSLGFGNPRTLLNSGNLVYAAHGKLTEVRQSNNHTSYLHSIRYSTKLVSTVSIRNRLDATPRPCIRIIGPFEPP
mgnify:CR=1 FL=1